MYQLFLFLSNPHLHQYTLLHLLRELVLELLGLVPCECGNFPLGCVVVKCSSAHIVHLHCGAERPYISLLPLQYCIKYLVDIGA